MPVYAILFGEVLGVLSKDVETARSDSIFYSFMFLVVGVVVGLAMFLQGNITNRSSKSSQQGVTLVTPAKNKLLCPKNWGFRSQWN